MNNSSPAFPSTNVIRRPVPRPSRSVNPGAAHGGGSRGNSATHSAAGPRRGDARRGARRHTGRKARSPIPKARKPAASRSPADVEAAERLLAAARGGADVRVRKVRRLKAAIKTKAYENELKLMVAVERLLSTAGTPLEP